MSLEIVEEDKNGLKVLHLKGRLDAVTSKELEAKIGTLLEAKTARLVCNLKEMDYLSSAGMRVFLGSSKKLSQNGGAFIVTDLTPEVLSIIKMAGFDQILTIKATLDEAIAGV
jgi:anti-anti-sigma factor